MGHPSARTSSASPTPLTTVTLSLTLTLHLQVRSPLLIRFTNLFDNRLPTGVLSKAYTMPTPAIVLRYCHAYDRVIGAWC